MRFGGIRRWVSTMLVALLTLAGVGLPTTPSHAVSALSMADLKARAIFFLHTGDVAQQEVVLGSMALKSNWEAGLWTEFLQSWATINNHLAMNATPPKGLPASGHLFVVLGSELSKSGKMTTKLERRMKVALAALKKYPHSKVLVSGGAAHKGHTEAEVMQKWLVDHKVAKSRILVEKKSASTVGNATNTMALLAKSPAFTSYSLISDSSHLRRASILFRAATVRVQEQTGKPWSIAQLANVAYVDMKTAGRGPLSASSVAYTATNVASVLSVLPVYKAVLGNPPSTAVLTSIVLSAPTRSTYAVGDPFDATGLVVRAVYDKGAYSRVVTGDATLSGFDSAAVGKGTVQASYTEGGVTKVAAFPYSIVKATSRLQVGLSTRTLKRSRTRLAVTASVTAPNGLLPTGQVKYYLDGKLLKTLTLDDKAGSLVFTYPKIRSTGKHTFVVTYSGNDQLTTARKSTTLTVKR